MASAFESGRPLSTSGPALPIPNTDAAPEPSRPSHNSAGSGLLSSKLPPEGICIPSTTASFFGGFQYIPALSELGIDVSNWEDFLRQLTRTNSLNGLGGGLLAGSDVLRLSSAVRPGDFETFYEANSLERDMRKEILREYEAAQVGGHWPEGRLGAVLKSWNRNFFEQRGLRVHLRIPDDEWLRYYEKKKGHGLSSLLHKHKEGPSEADLARHAEIMKGLPDVRYKIVIVPAQNAVSSSLKCCLCDLATNNLLVKDERVIQ